MRSRNGTLNVDCGDCGSLVAVPERWVLEGRDASCDDAGRSCADRPFDRPMAPRLDCAGRSCALWGDRLIKLMETRGLTVRQAAEVVGIHRTRVYRHRRDCPRFHLGFLRTGFVPRRRNGAGPDLSAPEAPAGWLDGRPRHTAATYAIRWRFWQKWCARKGRPAIPAQRADIIEYLIDRAERGSSPKTLMVDCYAIRAAHLAQPLPDPTVGLRRTMQPFTSMALTARKAMQAAAA